MSNLDMDLQIFRSYICFWKIINKNIKNKKNVCSFFLQTKNVLFILVITNRHQNTKWARRSRSLWNVQPISVWETDRHSRAADPNQGCTSSLALLEQDLFFKDRALTRISLRKKEEIIKTQARSLSMKRFQMSLCQARSIPPHVCVAGKAKKSKP